MVIALKVDGSILKEKSVNLNPLRIVMCTIGAVMAGALSSALIGSFWISIIVGAGAAGIGLAVTRDME